MTEEDTSCKARALYIVILDSRKAM
jgi:hypothetical protein